MTSRPTPDSRRDGRLWPKLFLAVATMAAMLPLLEVAVRWLAPQRASWLAIYRQDPAVGSYSYQPNVNVTVDTGESRWSVHTDGRGFRIGQRPARDDGRPLVLWLGDSFTFGYAVEYEDSFVGRLAQHPGSASLLVNAAVGGHGPVQYRQMLQHLLDTGLRPRVVLVGVFLGNDFWNCIDDTAQLQVRDGILGNEGGLKSFLKLHLHLYRLATNALHRLRPPSLRPERRSDDQSNPLSWSEGPMREADRVFRQEFESMAALCKAHGAQFAVLVLPSAPMVDAVAKGAPKRSDGTLDPTLPLKHAVATFKDLAIRYLDATEMLARHPIADSYFYYDGHFTPTGHALVAAEISSEWRDLLPER